MSAAACRNRRVGALAGFDILYAFARGGERQLCESEEVSALAPVVACVAGLLQPTGVPFGTDSE